MKTNHKSWQELSKKEKVIRIIIVFLFISLINAGIRGLTSKPEQDSQTEKLSETNPTEKPKPADLNAVVRFNEVAFQVINQEKVDWTDCKLEMNSGIIRGGYTYSMSVIPSQEPQLIPFREFTKGDGTRFNSYETKAQTLFISCNIAGTLRFGSYDIN